jgi:hypothetical protein
MRYGWAAVLFLFYTLGSISSLRAEVVSGSRRCASEWCSQDRPPRTIATTARIVTISTTDKTMRVSSSLALRNGKGDQPKRISGFKNTDEYTVIATAHTVFQDGVDRIHFEDFKTGETISIHGLLKGTTLTAFRLAKWE